MIQAVTFDFWETLVSEGSGIDAAFSRNWEVFHESWRTNVQHGPAEATPLICELLGVDPPPDVRAALLGSFHEVGLGAPLRLAPGVEECIRRLKDAGVRIGIICDFGMTASPTLRERLDTFGVLRYFDHWSFSDEVGCFKPWPAVFEHAFAGLGVDDPSSAAHVGDSRRTDVAGAQAMGMTAVRYTYFLDAPADDEPEADHVLDDHAKLAPALGIA